MEPDLLLIKGYHKYTSKAPDGQGGWKYVYDAAAVRRLHQAAAEAGFAHLDEAIAAHAHGSDPRLARMPAKYRAQLANPPQQLDQSDPAIAEWYNQLQIATEHAGRPAAAPEPGERPAAHRQERLLLSMGPLSKAKKGEIKPGHKWTKRSRNAAGNLVYEYEPDTPAPAESQQPAGVQFYVTVDSDSIREYMPAVPVLLPVSSWVRKAKLDAAGHVAGDIPVPALPAKFHDEDIEIGCDGGGFVAARKWGGEYIFSHEQYAKWLDQVQPTWAAMLDYCVEPQIASSPMSVRIRQQRTTANAQAIWNEYKNKPWAWVPTIQGWTVEDYQQHAREMAPLLREMAEHYQAQGLDHAFRIGVGTLCCRTSRAQIQAIVAAVAEVLPGAPLHLWGVKLDAFKGGVALPDQVVSSDSAAWSGRFGKDIEKYKTSGLTQREHAYTVALPAYQDKVKAAQSAPKQKGFDLPAALYDWAKMSEQNPMLPPPAFTCSACDTECDYDGTWEALEDDEKDEIRAFLAMGVCPACSAPLSKKDRKRSRLALGMAARPLLIMDIAARASGAYSEHNDSADERPIDEP